MAHLLHRLGAFAVRRRRTVLVGWLVALTLLGGLTMGLKGTFSSEFSIPGTESQQAAELVAERIPGANPDAATGRVVFAAPAGASLQTGERKAAVEESVAALGKVATVASASDPFAARTISQDGRIAYSDLGFTVGPLDVTATQTDAIAAATTSGEAGRHPGRVRRGRRPGGVGAAVGEGLGVVVALLVLTVTFGSLLAAGLPLLTGVLGVGIGALGITLASGFTDLTDTSLTLAVMLGLAVGIDYTLFILSRHRTQVKDGMTIEASIAQGGRHGRQRRRVRRRHRGHRTRRAGRHRGPVPGPDGYRRRGDRRDRGAAQPDLRAGPARRRRPARRARQDVLARAARRRGRREADHGRPLDRPGHPAPLVSRSSSSALALLALAAPALHMRLGLPDDGTAAPATTQRRRTTCSPTGFGPGFNGPLTVVADLAGVTDRAAGRRHDRGAAAQASTTSPPSPRRSWTRRKDLAIITVVPTSGPSAAATTDLVTAIRDDAASHPAADRGRAVGDRSDRDEHRHLPADVRRAGRRTWRSSSGSRCCC